jgi:hypothetical protein
VLINRQVEPAKHELVRLCLCEQLCKVFPRFLASQNLLIRQVGSGSVHEGKRPLLGPLARLLTLASGGTLARKGRSWTAGAVT